MSSLEAVAFEIICGSSACLSWLSIFFYVVVQNADRNFSYLLANQMSKAQAYALHLAHV
jgi:hypothetical protein